MLLKKFVFWHLYFCRRIFLIISEVINIFCLTWRCYHGIVIWFRRWNEGIDQRTCVTDFDHLLILLFIITAVFYTCNKPYPVIHKLTWAYNEGPFFLIFAFIGPFHAQGGYFSLNRKKFKIDKFIEQYFFLYGIGSDFFVFFVGEISLWYSGEIGYWLLLHI